MSLSALLLPDFDVEMATTRRLLERVPDGRNDWRPHPRSTTLGRLATHVSEMPSWVTNTFQLDELDIFPGGKPPIAWPVLPSQAAILEQFDTNAAAARAALAAARDEDFTRPWTLKFGGQSAWTRTKHQVYHVWAIHHLVHHRAQLGVFLRLLDIPIPGSYGPSADERPGG